MENMPACLALVTRCVSAPAPVLAQLFHESESFRSLCEDFQACLKVRDYWGQCRSEKREAAGLYEEYATLSKELLAEIESLLADHVTGSNRPRKGNQTFS